MTNKFRDKKRNYSIAEEEYSHPRHEPYKRGHVDWHNLLVAEADEQIDSLDSDERLTYKEYCEKYDLPYDESKDYFLEPKA